MKSLIQYKSNNNVVYSCKYHVVWCPKYRRSVLINGVDERLKSIVLEVAEETRSDVIEMEIMPDHVHLLVECDPQFGINQDMRYIAVLHNQTTPKGTDLYYTRKPFNYQKRRKAM
ncbi:transposase IS200-family protein [Neobacillus vireti LMG 21834]|uniref:Transposase IS200-family protein n=1 Tax=Neobacillus vireti LMG 21834 TaxID=1131730 RepID=A0AB94IS05_9BACI|nr:IS200/IS605 family transposase [Neobacillus vireti]ETI69748.1 transposase IS200-family protein [Neobacillus vireti LMG 21834]